MEKTESVYYFIVRYNMKNRTQTVSPIRKKKMTVQEVVGHFRPKRQKNGITVEYQIFLLKSEAERAHSNELKWCK